MSKENQEKNKSLSELERKIQGILSDINTIKKNDNNFEDVINNNEKLQKELKEKTQAYEKLQEEFQAAKQKILDMEQEKMFYEKYSKLSEDEKEKAKQEYGEIKEKYNKERQQTLESEQEKMFLEKSLEVEERQKIAANKKYYKAIIFSAIAIAVIAGVYSVMFAEIAGEQYKVQIEPQASGYTIQNLKGDKITTWLSWKLAQDDTLHINILNSENYDPEIIDAVKRTIMSDEIFEIDNSLLFKGPQGTTEFYYVGWKGALEKVAESDTKFYVPSKIEVLESASGEGDITIELVDYSNADGFAGWTNSIADDTQNQILKARITIFDSDKLTPVEMETVLRHELGHAFGLAHTEASEDLMAPVITTEYPYISPCDLAAIVSLYDGSETSEITCEI